jgi:hypothetical protein
MRAPGRNDRCTPEHVLEVVRAFNRIALDPCSNPWSTVRACRQLMLEGGDDGLAADWVGLTEALPYTPRLVWVQPPYGPGQIRRWLRKASLEVLVGGGDMEAIALVPNDASTAWCQEARRGCDAYLDVAKRIGFVGPDLRPGHEGEWLDTGAKQPSQLIYWGTRPWHFSAHFSVLGTPHVERRGVAA